MLFKLMQTFGNRKFLLLMQPLRFTSRYFMLLLIAAVCVLSSFNDAYKSGSASRHPFYVTVTEFNHNIKEKQLEISCKLFADDLEATLKKQFKTQVDITHPKDPKALDKMLMEYCSQHLKLKINGNPVQLQYVGFEKESEAAWCYFEVPGINGVKRLEITNNLLYEMYDSEISIMRASVGGVAKNTKLEFPATQAVFEW